MIPVVSLKQRNKRIRISSAVYYTFDLDTLRIIIIYIKIIQFLKIDRKSGIFMRRRYNISFGILLALIPLSGMIYSFIGDLSRFSYPVSSPIFGHKYIGEYDLIWF